MELHPEALLVTAPSVALALYYVPRMYLDRALTGSEAAAASGIVLGLCGVCHSIWGAAPGYALGVVIIAAIGCLPYARRMLSRRDELAVAERELAEWRRTIAFDARNRGAYVYAAEALRNLGRYAEAVSLYERAMALGPRDPAVQRALEVTTQLKRASAGENWICTTCRAENAARIRECFRCGAHLPLAGAAGSPVAAYGIAPLAALVVPASALGICGAISPSAMLLLCWLGALGVVVFYAIVSPASED